MEKKQLYHLMATSMNRKERIVFLRLAIYLLLLGGGVGFVAGVLAFWLLSFFYYIPPIVKHIGIYVMTGAGLLQSGPDFIRFLKLYCSDWSPIGKKVFLRIKESKEQALAGLALEGVYVNSVSAEVGEIKLDVPLVIGGGSVQALFFTARKLKEYSANITKGVMEISLFAAPGSQSPEDAIAIADMHIEKGC